MYYRRYCALWNDFFEGEKQATRKRGRAVLSDSDSEGEPGAKNKVTGSDREEENESGPSGHAEATGEGVPEEEDGATAAAAVVPDVSDDSDDGRVNNINRGYV